MIRKLFAVSVICLSTLACNGNSDDRSIASAFDPDAFDSRISSADVRYCEPGTIPEIVVEGNSEVDARAPALVGTLDVFSAAHFSICNGVIQEDESYVSVEETARVSGYYYLKTTAFETKWYWVYIYLPMRSI